MFRWLLFLRKILGLWDVGTLSLRRVAHWQWSTPQFLLEALVGPWSGDACRSSFSAAVFTPCLPFESPPDMASWG